jgi:WD40 repeat protein
MRPTPYTASRFSVGLQEFLFACAYWYVASDAAIHSAERAWLAKQFGVAGSDELIRRFSSLTSPDFFDVFDGLAAALTDDEKRELFPGLEVWLQSCAEVEGQLTPERVSVMDAILKRLKVQDELARLSHFTAETVRVNAAPDVAAAPAKPPRRVRALLGHTGEVNAVDVSADGARVLTAASDGRVRIWRVEDGRETLAVVADQLGATGGLFLGDGTRFAAVGRLGTIGCWKTDDGDMLWSGAEKRVGGLTSLDVSPDGEWLVCASENGHIALRRTADGRREAEFGQGVGGVVHDVCFTPDGKLVAAACDDRLVRFWNPRTGKQVHAFVGHADAVLSLAFSSDGDWMISGGRDSTIQMWEMRTGQSVRVIRKHAFHVSGVALRRDNRMLASASWDHTLKLWDMESGELRLNIESASVRFNCVAFLPDGAHLLAGCSDKSACVIPFELS